jgi:hypothetical protein
MTGKTMAAMAAALAALPLFAKIEMGTPFSDGAVLQRGMKVPVWGRVVSPDAGTKESTTSSPGQLSPIGKTDTCGEGLTPR